MAVRRKTIPLPDQPVTPYLHGAHPREYCHYIIRESIAIINVTKTAVEMKELRIFDHDPNRPSLLIPLSELLLALSRYDSECITGQWVIIGRCSGYGETVGRVSKETRQFGSAIIEANDIVPKILTGEEWFEDVAMYNCRSGIKIGTVDSTYHFVRGNRKLLRYVAPQFGHTSWVCEER